MMTTTEASALERAPGQQGHTRPTAGPVMRRLTWGERMVLSTVAASRPVFDGRLKAVYHLVKLGFIEDGPHSWQLTGDGVRQLHAMVLARQGV